ncbi:alpha/beta hydrolase [Nonomuraea sp. NPDC050202]|uniref:alpha/beta fold hydrolase n=1 Tax=Nonomuraea sp. NPDC050202 TaxID=3155035 RepID=UPI0033E16C79
MPSTSDLAQVRHANAIGPIPVVFLHGPWLLPTSWERWAGVFDEAGFAPVIPAWPAGSPSRAAGWTAGEVADHFAGLIGGLEHKPAVVGHSTGGLLAQIIAGRGLASASVAIGPAPFHGVLPLPLSPPRAPAGPADVSGAIPLTYEQFRHAFANAVGEEEAGRLYEMFAVPAPGVPPLQTSGAAFAPWSEPEPDVAAKDRGPLLLISGERDLIVPWAAVHDSYKVQARNEQHLTEIVELPGRGHSLTVDSGWREVCGTALTFIQRFVDP